MGVRVNFHSFLLVLSLLTAMGTSACLDKKGVIKPPRGSPSGSASSLDFSGAVSAQNLSADGLSIQINWSIAKPPYTKYVVYSVASDGSMTALNKSTLSLSQTSYTQTGLISGQLYSFVVQAVRSDGVSDGNKKVVSALAYSGIKTVGGATGVSLNSAFINFPAVGAQSVGAQINCQNMNGTAVTNFTVYSTSATSQALTGLHSGTTYRCKVNALYSDFLGNVVADSNAVTFSFQTISLGYTQTTPAFQGVILVQAFGDAPTAPIPAAAPAALPSPVPVLSTRQVNITWKNFTSVDPWNAQYRLVRVRQGGAFDMNTNASCGANTITSCQVCVSSAGNNPISRTCSDSVASLGRAPSRYDYAVSLIVDPNAIPPLAEEMPTLSSDLPFRISVPIPPDNMVLVHRDSVNYDICSYMNLPTDPLNHQRCVYTGLGAIPFNSGAFGSATQMTLTGNPGTAYSGVVNNGDFYDFGYNLFVDRWEAGCRWTPSPAAATGGTGMCGPGATPGNCFGSTGPPLASVGVNGNVFVDFSLDPVGICYVKQSGVWTQAGFGVMTIASMRAMVSSVPDRVNKVPPLNRLYASQASPFCQVQIDPNYGPKRLLRKRESVAAIPFQWMPGEPEQMTTTQIMSVQTGATSHTVFPGCDSASGPTGVTFGTFNDSSQLTSTRVFTIGSHYTAGCVSRFGVQDLMGNNYEHLSDNIRCSNVTHACTGMDSLLDPGNKDLTFLGQYNFDGVTLTGPGGTVPFGTSSYYAIQSQSFGSTHFSVPMGLPFISNNNGNAMPVPSLRSTEQGNTIYVMPDTMNGVSQMLSPGTAWSSVNGRFVYESSNRFYYGLRCALPAE